jgi:hypothetical protein
LPDPAAAATTVRAAVGVPGSPVTMVSQPRAAHRIERTLSAIPAASRRS